MNRLGVNGGQREELDFVAREERGAGARREGAGDDAEGDAEAGDGVARFAEHSFGGAAVAEFGERAFGGGERRFAHGLFDERQNPQTRPAWGVGG